MGFDAKEKADLVAKLFDLGSDLIAAFGPDSDGGKKVTRKELKTLGRRCLSLGAQVLIDWLD